MDQSYLLPIRSSIELDGLLFITLTNSKIDNDSLRFFTHITTHIQFALDRCLPYEDARRDYQETVALRHQKNYSV